LEDKSFITIIAAVLDDNKDRVTIARAGHLPVIVYEKSANQCECWAPGGIGLAMEKGEIFEKALTEDQKTLQSGDVLLLYSDGLVEAENSRGEEFGEKRLEVVFQEHGHEDAKTLGKTIFDAIHSFTKNEAQKDDMTLVVIKKE
jgi:serine phosphatase RsbU (regulator of sigma subunit)